MEKQDGGGGNVTLGNRYKCFTEAVAAGSWGSRPGSDTALLQGSQIYPVQKSNPRAGQTPIALQLPEPNSKPSGWPK